MSRSKHQDHPTTERNWLIRVGISHVSRSGYQLWACAVQYIGGQESIPLSSYQFRPLEKALRFSESRLNTLASSHLSGAEAMALATQVAAYSALTLTTHAPTQT